MIINLNKENIPEKIPDSIQEAVNVIKESKDQKEALRKAYEVMSEKFNAHRIETWTCLYRLFYPLEKIWAKGGSYQCTVYNFLLRILLIKSGFFRDEEISQKWTMIFFVSPHQYLRIKMNDGCELNIDFWSRTYGVMFGDYAHGFKSGSLFRQKTKFKKTKVRTRTGN